MAKYEQLVSQIQQQIHTGVWLAGDKLPSLRKQAEHAGMSLMTVLQAYQVLESQGWVVSYPRSGYRVAPEMAQQVQDTMAVQPTESVDVNDFIFDVLQASRNPRMASFGHAYLDPALAPRHQVNKSLTAAVRTMPLSSVVDNLPPGNDELRHLIAKRYAAQGMNISPDEIVITAGGLEALNLSLRAVTRPGDWVVVESPTFYGALQSLENLGLKAIAVRTHPGEGIDLGSLERALQTHSVRACWLMTNLQNPLGYSLSVEKKQQLAALLNKYQVHLIEDDVYSELYVGDSKPLPAKAFDAQGRFMHCSSFSKTLVEGFRIGWVAAGKQALKIQKLQLMSTLTTSVPIQLALVHYLTTRNYGSHLRLLRRTLDQRKAANEVCLKANLPDCARIYNSEGGYFLWVELPRHVDTTVLYHLALAETISIAPGRMFATSNQFNHCFRFNASFALTDAHQQAIVRLGELVKQLI
ncbi:PLP-dependent aminotransferase family protein [Photobacterium sp. TY1-4]|uniref:aminotransferase-like domain-containing protein n=1 Tax=Photobacterium sp. TY1-4 TaxID=2899122 RepID=UPI0021C15974|nr:PLP-dependent aminotransferase family protein [Photobacterium sp. TY1-4]UXI03281.1 PLP-dependent aminotransferase family protein [Photobacterium sp. TY1-4]